MTLNADTAHSAFLTWPSIGNRIVHARNPIAWVQANVSVILRDGRCAHPTAEVAELLIAHRNGALSFIPVVVSDDSYELVDLSGALDAIADAIAF